MFESSRIAIENLKSKLIVAVTVVKLQQQVLDTDEQLLQIQAEKIKKCLLLSTLPSTRESDAKDNQALSRTIKDCKSRD